jgi:hypothetical protein
MIYSRKNFDNVWKLCKLGKEDIAAVETATVTHGLRMMQRINKTAAENNLKLSEIDRAAQIVWAALTFESFASDFIEAKVIADKKAEEAKNQPPY